MSKYLNNQNVDDLYLFNLIVALLEFLNEKLILTQYLDDMEYDYIIPFFYNAGGDERFMQDIFQQSSFKQNIRTKVAEGNYDIIPRGHVTLNSATIQASSLTNRFVRGYYQVETPTEIETHNAPMNIIPLVFQFQIEIKVDTLSMLFKVWEKVVQTFYKVWAFEYMHEGMPIRASISFPEDKTMEHAYEFTFGDINDKKLTFTVELESYFFVKDMTQDFKKSQRITQFDVNLEYGAVAIKSRVEGWESGNTYQGYVDYPQYPTNADNVGQIGWQGGPAYVEGLGYIGGQGYFEGSGNVPPGGTGYYGGGQYVTGVGYVGGAGVIPGVGAGYTSGSGYPLGIGGGFTGGTGYQQGTLLGLNSESTTLTPPVEAVDSDFLGYAPYADMVIDPTKEFNFDGEKPDVKTTH